MGEWKALKRESGSGAWKYIYCEAGSGAWKELEWESDYEDFTTYTEVDIAADRIQKTANHVDHLNYTSETTYLYKDYGAAHFGDFTHKIKVQMTDANTSGIGYCWLLTNAVGDVSGLRGANSTYITLFFYSTNVLYLREHYDGGYYSDSYTISNNTWYYIKIVKSGTSLNAYIYSDSSYTTLLDTLTITLQGNHTFRYLYACNTLGSGSAYIKTMDIENFDL